MAWSDTGPRVTSPSPYRHSTEDRRLGVGLGVGDEGVGKGHGESLRTEDFGD